MMGHVDFTVGTWSHKPAGRRPSLPPPPKGIGDQFVEENPIWFEGCGCKKGVIPVINRWKTSPPTETALITVAKTIRNKNKKVDLDIIVESLTLFVESIHDQD